MIQVTCSNCGIRFLVPTTVQGRTGTCFGCGAPLKVPTGANVPQNFDLTFTPGTRISDRYILQERIGQGGMGVVYRALDTLVKEEIAIKLMKPQLLKSKEWHRDFIQEAQVARRLRHENIVAVHDISWTPEGILYFTMEFLRGQSLRAVLRRHRQERKLVEVRLAVSIVNQILSALDYAHRTVMHRDLKPENVMLLAGERIKVLDFGLARAVDEEALTASGRHTEDVVGTWAYAAPEQKKPGRKVDLRADIYSVGLVLHELLTLRTPLDQAVKVQRVRDDVSPSLMEVHDRGLAPEPEDRWQSAGEFREALMQAFEQSYKAVLAPQEEAETGRTASTEGMVYLEGGSFLMGNNEVDEESPEFEAYVEPFYIDKYPVTVKQYAAFLEATGHPAPRFWQAAQFSGPMQPVVGVSWHDANTYATWAGKLLPTEAQWEYAARGKEDRLYPWGGRDPDRNLCNFGDYLGMPSIVTMHEEGKTPQGVCDLAGNVYEWTRDPYVPYPQRGNANAPSNRVVIRGGCWKSGVETLRCSHRNGFFPESQLPTLGFRCVLPAQAAMKKANE